MLGAVCRGRRDINIWRNAEQTPPAMSARAEEWHPRDKGFLCSGRVPSCWCRVPNSDPQSRATLKGQEIALAFHLRALVAGGPWGSLEASSSMLMNKLCDLDDGKRIASPDASPMSVTSSRLSRRVQIKFEATSMNSPIAGSNHAPRLFQGLLHSTIRFNKKSTSYFVRETAPSDTATLPPERL